LLGAGDSLEGFAPRHPVIRDLSRRYAGMRMGRTNRVFEALAPVILEQKVTTLAAMQSWYGIVRR
jgi:3-methyladenine DNA glycosylase/8-oxoguanine DNA glycosylase